ncbi:CpXC domain-containing protein [Streptococcus parasuis]|uniref:CpXC domain-containing protein n=1 Tax=Streptococcus parasuis TaxID=1501662 RepID=UPI0023794201|nr:CpXC domain-containing protein [Streptococcus parasuis]
MTDIYLSYLNCPKCGEKNPHQRHNIIDIGLEPELTKQIIDWEFFKFSCQNCTHEQFVTYPTLYLDVEKKLLFIISLILMKLCSLGSNLS